MLSGKPWPAPDTLAYATNASTNVGRPQARACPRITNLNGNLGPYGNMLIRCYTRYTLPPYQHPFPLPAHFCALFARQKRSDAPSYSHVLLSCGPAATLTPDLVGIGAIRRGRSSLPVTFQV